MNKRSNSGSAQISGRSPRDAFSLTELLVVMGVIVILAAMILAGVTKARTRSTSVKCANNLRILMTALNTHLDANGGKFPKVSYFMNALHPLTGLEWDPNNPNNPAYPYSCPSARYPGIGPTGRAHWVNCGYGTNPCLMPPAAIHNHQTSPWQPDEYVLQGRITRPAEILVMADAGQQWAGHSPSMCQWWGEYNEIRAYGAVDPSRADEPVSTAANRGVGQLSWMPPGDPLLNHRHGDFAMAVFLDGHVEPLRSGMLLQRNLHTLY